MLWERDHIGASAKLLKHQRIIRLAFRLAPIGGSFPIGFLVSPHGNLTGNTPISGPTGPIRGRELFLLQDETV